jgi:hypothetical protein
MRYLVRHVPEREQWLSHLQQHIPNLEIVRDRERVARTTFLAALELAGDDAAVHLEDDIVLTNDFVAKIEAVVAEHAKRVVQFFSLRKRDPELGSRLMPGRSFLMAQCFYLPAGWGPSLRANEVTWPRPTTGYAGTSDKMIQDWLAARRVSYWLHVPSLVQHRPIPSAINPKRPRVRQSPSFVI